MVVTILLVADEEAEAVEVSRSVEVRTDGTAWQAELVGSIEDHARAGALCLLEQIEHAERHDDFVPLASVLPALDTTRR